MSFIFSVQTAEAVARRQLAVARELDIHDHTQMCMSHGLLTTVLGNLLDALAAERDELKEAA